MCAVLSEASDEEWNYALNELNSSIVSNEKMEVANAMTCTQNKGKLEMWDLNI